MANNQVYRLSAKTIEALNFELLELKTKGRQEITDRLHDIQIQTIEELDSPFVEASDERILLESRIVEIEKILEDATSYDTDHSVDIVGIGSIVTVKVGNKKREFQIVDEIETDPIAGKIAPQSPVGAALCNQKPGTEVEVDVNGKKILYKIISIK